MDHADRIVIGVIVQKPGSFITQHGGLLMSHLGIRLFLLVALIGVFAVALQSSSAQAAVSALPPRPTPVPIAGSGSAGATIQLHVTAAPFGAWTIVQWQDMIGGWHDVTGWQGTLDNDSTKTWWVFKSDFGKGPFRWVVTNADRSRWLGVSTSFNLPSRTRETVKMEVTIAP
jgi:hypothetical protein